MSSTSRQDQDQHRRVLAAREPLPDEAVESIATWLRVIGEPNRIRLIEILNSGGTGVQDLADRLGTTRQNVSKHLAVLHQAGIVTRRRSKNCVTYELCDWSGWWVIEQVGRSVAAALEERFSALRNSAVS